MDTETFNKQAPIAIAVLGQHLVEYDLPAPMSIDVYPEEQTIRVRLGGGPEVHRRWLDTVQLIDEVTSALEHPSAGLRTAWTVRLPDLGIGLELVAFRMAPFVAAVSA